MFKKVLNRGVVCITTLVALLAISVSSHASCLLSENANLDGSWSGGNFMGGPDKAINITYTPPTSQRVQRCETRIKRGGFPFFGRVEYEHCYITWECRGGGFHGSSIKWMTFGPNHVNSAEAAGVEVGEWLRFEFDSTDPIRIWVRQGSSSNRIDFVRDIAPFGGPYTWSELTRD